MENASRSCRRLFYKPANASSEFPGSIFTHWRPYEWRAFGREAFATNPKDVDGMVLQECITYDLEDAYPEGVEGEAKSKDILYELAVSTLMYVLRRWS